jgi:Protein of unknown function (DUF992)
MVLMWKHGRILAVIALLAALNTSLAAQPANGTKAGVLTCRTSASLGLIVGSHQKLACRFTPDIGGPPEHYVGHINRLGLDLGVRAGGAMVWAVVAPTNGYHHGALAGKYVGASGSVSFGLGAGAHVLVGGSHRSIALQPLSVEGQAGINLALGVAGLTLHAAH